MKVFCPWLIAWMKGIEIIINRGISAQVFQVVPSGSIRFMRKTLAAKAIILMACQVSKAIGRLEAHFHTKLFRRSAQGVQLSESGVRLAPRLEEIVSRLREMNRALHAKHLPTMTRSPARSLKRE